MVLTAESLTGDETEFTLEMQRCSVNRVRVCARVRACVGLCCPSPAAVNVLERDTTPPPPARLRPALRAPVRQPRLCAICISAPSSAKALD